MQNNFELPLVLQPQSPVWFKIWMNIIHIGAVLSIWIAAINWAYKVPLLLLIAASYRNIRAKYFHHNHAGSVVRLLCNEDDEWWLTYADGVTCQAELLAPCFVHARLVILDFKSGKSWWQRSHVILTPSMVDSNSLRRLRVRLRYPRRTIADVPASR